MPGKKEPDAFSAESLVQLLSQIDPKTDETPIQNFKFNVLKARVLQATALEISDNFPKIYKKISAESTISFADVGLALYHVYTEQALVTAVSASEAYFKDRLAYAIQNDKRLLNRFADKELKVKRILDAGLDLSNAIGILIVENMNFQILGNVQIEYKRIFDFEPFTKEELKKLKEIFAIRHVIVHKSGIADHLFISETGLNYQVGNRLFFERDEILRMIEFIDRTVSKINSKLGG
ncbi:MAG: hypothetical protein AABX40_02040 [Candidatus Hydrothermarchaeota archaeon]